ncbi:28S rRNA (cytosine-C(5))-methyltransferase-like [Penaeus chinensis]|uniref:28S rRNA (cytosine-C(5))-methyltransferase-like n=1 Tax=Penaeus chinensis TaxID=139456 RepID=UPI001FB657CC|nr:28S rRNA (cytosine-C(5))-methyltransferase-like [Penaeus chinensis]
MEKRPHSIPVPKLYKEAAKLLKRYENKEGTIKNLVLSNKKYRNYRTLSALMCKTVQNATRIQTAIAASNLLVEQPRFDPHLAKILTSELINKGRLPGNSKPEITLLEYEEKIRKIIGTDLNANNEEKEKDPLPRYVRINTLTTNADRVHSHLAREGWRCEEQDFSSYEDFLNCVQNLDTDSYMVDYHMKDLLVFPPNTPFWNDSFYRKGAVILQDKASCLPVFLSDIKSGSNIIDACAAPGNKTSHIAAVIGNEGKILAVEKDNERFATLQKLMKERGVESITFENRDFTKLSLDLYGEAHYIFLDPTCSASGLNIIKDNISPQRIKGLASFQIHLLQFALSFPFVKEVVYSTCSVYEEENEEVIEEALKAYGHQFELEDIGKKLDGWKHFGKEGYEFGSKCVRTVPDVDRCHGFFVAKFVRKAEPDEEGAFKCVENHCTEDKEREELKSSIKAKRKKKSRRDDEAGDEEADGQTLKNNAVSCDSELREDLEEVEHNHDGDQTQKKKKKKKKSAEDDGGEVHSGETEKDNVVSCESELTEDVEEVEDSHVEDDSQKKKKKKKKKKKSVIGDDDEENNRDRGQESAVSCESEFRVVLMEVDDNNDGDHTQKKKKKKSARDIGCAVHIGETETDHVVSCESKLKEDMEELEDKQDEDHTQKKRKKKKKKTVGDEVDNENSGDRAGSCENELKEDLEQVENDHDIDSTLKKKKKKKRSRESESGSGIPQDNLLDNSNLEENIIKKKKKNSLSNSND